MTFKPQLPYVKPRKNLQIALHPSDELMEKIQSTARENGLSMNRLMCQAIEYALDSMDKQPAPQISLNDGANHED